MIIHRSPPCPAFVFVRLIVFVFVFVRWLKRLPKHPPCPVAGGFNGWQEEEEVELEELEEEEKDIEETFPEEEKEVRREMKDRIHARVEKYQERE